jgi:hypothetical protein
MENKYQRGKIYKLVCNKTGLTYYGSTIQTLKKRLWAHINNNNCYSKVIIANNDYNIILLEEYPCNSLKELQLRERYYTENNNCVNRYVPSRTKKEWLEETGYNATYYYENQEKILQQKKEYLEKNRDKINSKRTEVLICECGCEYTYGHSARHRKTKRHIKLMEEITISK